MTNTPTNVRSCQEIFGAPPLLTGEDQAAFDELHCRVKAAVMATDIIDEMYVADIVCEQWEVMRWRRVKLTAQRNALLRAVRNFLHPHIDFPFEETAVRLLQLYLVEGQTLEEAEAVEALHEMLETRHLTLEDLVAKARHATAWDLAKLYGRGEASIVEWVDGLLAEASLILDDLLIPELRPQLDFIDSVDRFITISEARRNASLRAIERRRATLGAALRRSVQQIEQDDPKLIEGKPTEKQDAA